MPSTIDTADSGALSELENLSDSDWLDISSRASEDTDSIAGFDDSDREDSDGRPSSRRSFNSVGSSRDEEVHGWEGLAEDSADESPAEHRFTPDHLPLSIRLAALEDSGRSLSDAEQDPEEEQRVKDALDQSMMSTLSSSRSNSLNASVQTSMVHSRELRLSFPDPLTSSHDASLNTSYENVSTPLDEDLPKHDLEDTQASVSHGDAPSTLAPTTADPGSYAIPAVPEEDVFNREVAFLCPDFTVILYGSSPSTKWSLLDTVLEKIAHSAGLSLSTRLIASPEGHLRYLLPRGESRQGEKGRVVSVIDCTELDGDAAFQSSSLSFLQRPSLAVIFLPSTIVSLPEHTLYLPILAQNLSVVELPYSADRLLDAEHQWESFGVPQARRAVLSRGSSCVVDQEDIQRLRTLQAGRTFRPLLESADRKLVRRLNSTHAFTIFAVLSIVLGFVFKGSLSRPQTSHTPTFTTCSTINNCPEEPRNTPPPLWGLMRPVSLNQTHTPPTPSMAAVVPSLKELALAVLNPVASPFGTVSTSRESPTASSSNSKHDQGTAPSECLCGCGLISWPGKMKRSTDLILRPTPPSPSLTTQGVLSVFPSMSQGKGKGKAAPYLQENLHALSTRLAGSLSQYIDTNALMAITAGIRRDLQDVMDALDALMHAISRHTAGTWELSKDTVHTVREHVQYRHDRAQRKARELKELGGRLFSSVSDRVRGRADSAKENARALRDRIGSVDVWASAHMRREEAFNVRKTGQQERRDRMRRILKF